MENGLREKAEEWVAALGADYTTKMAKEFISNGCCCIDKKSVNDASAEMVIMKMHLGILEYLYCDSDLVDKDLKKQTR